VKEVTFKIHEDRTVDIEVIEGKVVAKDLLSVILASLDAIERTTGTSVKQIAEELANGL